MNRATSVTASVIGGYAGLLGAAHGYFETLQGSVAPDGIGINAMGAPCQGDAVWHACLPAMTIIPNFLATGVLAILFSLVALVWAAGFIQREKGGLILILLSILMLLVGGGFVPTFAGIIAGVAGTRINAPLTFWRSRFAGRSLSFLAKLWPRTLIAFVVWSLGGWLLGHFFNQTMLTLGVILFFFFDLELPLLTVFTGFARDIHRILTERKTLKIQTLFSMKP